MGPQYPELEHDRKRIESVAVTEETSFLQTLRTGSTMFETVAEETRKSGATVFSGAEAFKLHDTFGFPIDLTLEMAAEAGLTVDEDGFRRLMEEQRERAKADARAKKTGHVDMSAYRRAARRRGPSAFTGYARVAVRGRARGLLVDGVGRSRRRDEGDEVELVLDRTPFYAEGGGQLADHGLIGLGNGARGGGRRRAEAGRRADRAPRGSSRGEVAGRQRGAGRGRHRAALGDLPLAHRDAHGPQGVPRGARRDRDPGGLGELARAGSGSTSPHPARCRTRCSPTSSSGSTSC